METGLVTHIMYKGKNLTQARNKHCQMTWICCAGICPGTANLILFSQIKRFLQACLEMLNSDGRKEKPN